MPRILLATACLDNCGFSCSSAVQRPRFISLQPINPGFGNITKEMACGSNHISLTAFVDVNYFR